jgi:hypothetical protein
MSDEKGNFIEARCGVCGETRKFTPHENRIAWFKDFSAKHGRCIGDPDFSPLRRRDPR